MPTNYEILGVPEGASDEEVRHAYRRLVKDSHPDRAGDAVQFQRITQAYDVLSDPARRAAYDRGLRPGRAPVAPVAPPPPPRRYGRYVALLLAVALVGGIVWLVVAPGRQSVGDDCLVGTWRGDVFDVPFRAVLDDREVAAPIRGGAGVIARVASDGIARADYAQAEPLVGADGARRIEGIYSGTTIERWHAADGQVTQRGTDTSRLSFQATINGRAPDQPLAPTVVDRKYPYTCSATTLEVGPYRYVRA